MAASLARLLTCAMLVALGAGPLLAQQNQPDITALRSRDVLSAQDRQAVRAWVEAQVQALLKASSAKDSKAISAARRNLLDAAGQGATAGFRNLYAEVCASVFQPHLDGKDARVALHLIQVLGLLGEPSSIDGILAALGSRYPAVRYWAGRAIRDMHAGLAAIANVPERTIAALEAAGAKEGYPPAAQAIYEAIDFRAQAPRLANRVASALLTVLAGRAKFYGNKLIVDYYPDAHALGILAEMAGTLSDADKKRAIQVATSILQGCVRRWADVAPEDELLPVEQPNPYDTAGARQWRLRYQLALTSQQAEALLAKLAGAGSNDNLPDVAAKMRSLSTAAQVDAEFAKWKTLLAKPPAAAAPAPAGG